MARVHKITNAKTGETIDVPFTPAEEAAADAPTDFGPIDQAALNAALAAEGSVVRALALVLLQEINAVRQKLVPPLPAYTTQQLVSALQAKMR